MTIGKIKPTVTLAAQFVAGVEVDCIQHEGKLYLPVMGMGDFAKTVAPTPKETPKEEVKETPKKSKGKTVEKEEVKATSKVYTEKELMEKTVKELTLILDDLGIDPSDTEGKNTNKKLRTLVLENQEEGTPSDEDEDEVDEDEVDEDDTEESDGDDDDDDDDDEEDEEDEEDDDDGISLVDEITDILVDFDSGKLTNKKVVTKLFSMAVAEKVNKKEIVQLIEDFEQDEEAEFEDSAKLIADVLEGVKPKKAKEEKAAPTKKGKASGKSKEVLVTPDELEKGQRVSVYWEDEEDWYAGEVASIRKGKVTIDYDDETSEILDENNTKIKLL